MKGENQNAQNDKAGLFLLQRKRCGERGVNVTPLNTERKCRGSKQQQNQRKQADEIQREDVFIARSGEQIMFSEILLHKQDIYRIDDDCQRIQQKGFERDVAVGEIQLVCGGSGQLIGQGIPQ